MMIPASADSHPCGAKAELAHVAFDRDGGMTVSTRTISCDLQAGHGLVPHEASVDGYPLYQWSAL